MIKTRIAGTAAVFTFGLAAIGGTALAVAAPGNADTGASGSTSSSTTSDAPAQTNHSTLSPAMQDMIGKALAKNMNRMDRRG